MGAGRQKWQKVLPLQICQVQAAEQGRQLGPLPPAHGDHVPPLLDAVQQRLLMSMLCLNRAVDWLEVSGCAKPSLRWRGTQVPCCPRKSRSVSLCVCHLFASQECHAKVCLFFVISAARLQSMEVPPSEVSHICCMPRQHA